MCVYIYVPLMMCDKGTYIHISICREASNHLLDDSGADTEIIHSTVVYAVLQLYHSYWENIMFMLLCCCS